MTIRRFHRCPVCNSATTSSLWCDVAGADKMIDDRPLTSFALAMIYCLICVLLLTAPNWYPYFTAAFSCSY